MAQEIPPPLRLPPRMAVLCVAIPVAAFLFWTGPIWTHPWDIDALDSAIWWSYVPLPVLVLVCLAWSRRLSLRAFLLETLTLTLIKYSITFSIALVLWSVSGPPPRVAVLASLRAEVPWVGRPPRPPPFRRRAQAPSEAWRRTPRGDRCRARSVWIEAGLERYVFAPPAEPLLLDNDGGGVRPRLSVAQVRQVISARSADGRLHALVAASADGPLFNIPLLSSGARSSVVVREPHGISALRCAVHQGHIEAKSYLAVLSHPFWAITDEHGQFAWQGVPAGELRVAAFHPDLGEASAPAALSRGETLVVSADLRPAETGRAPHPR